MLGEEREGGGEGGRGERYDCSNEGGKMTLYVCGCVCAYVKCS